MWTVVLWLNVVWRLYGLEASQHEPHYEYLHVRRDGVAQMEPLSIPIYGNDADNRTYLINNSPSLKDQETIQALRRRDQLQKWKNIGVHISSQNKYRLYGPEKHGRSKLGSNKVKALSILEKSLKYDEESQCVKGKATSVDCNQCVCMGGQLYICTSRKCATDKQVVRKKKRGQKHVVFSKETSCIEGEQIRSFDGCNHCYCGGGQIICTRRKCQGNQNILLRECDPGKRIPSPDGCNTCTCNTRGIIVCTAKACGPEISKHIADKGCVPNSWYSPSGNSRCKECYCVNGKVAFCYMSLCAGKSNKRTALKLTLPGSLPDKCQMHEYIQDKCTRCECGTNGVWSCLTKEISKTCTDAVPDKLKKASRRARNHHISPYTPYTRRLSGFLSSSLRSTMSTYLDVKPGDQWYNSKKSHRSRMTTMQVYDKTTGFESEDDTELFDNEQKIPESPFPGELSPEDGEIMEIHEPDINPLEYPEGPGGPTMPGGDEDPVRPDRPDIPGDGVGKFDPENTLESAESEIDTNIDRGPYCVTGQFFTQGSNHTCHGCFCTPTNEWMCWSMKDACRGSAPCNPGKIKKNREAPCSVCYCGADGKNYCATDESCSYSIQPSKCEAIACLNYCVATNANFGVCHQDKCVCGH